MIYYLAHPLGTGGTRLANLARVKRWLAWLLKTYPDHSFCCPWVAYAEALSDEPASHERGLRDDLEILRRCDGLVLCGGELSPGMRTEFMKYCRWRGVQGLPVHVLDLLSRGKEPPKAESNG